MSAFGCINNTILLRSGIYFDLALPRAEHVRIDDIAGALSKICRYGGQCPRFLSVAEHCCNCYDAALADGLGERIAKLCLLHDAAEAFVGDMVKPLKVMLPDFARIELAVELAIQQAFQLRLNDGDLRAVKRIDMEMLIAERLALWGDDGVVWTGQSEVKVRDLWIEGWEASQAEAQFLDRAGKCGITIPKGGA